MKHVFYAILAASVLTACATPSLDSKLAEPPMVVVASEKQHEAAAMCMVDALKFQSALGTMPKFEVRTLTGRTDVRMYMPGGPLGGDTDFSYFSAVQNRSGSIIEIRSPYSKVSSEVVGATKACTK